MCGRGHRGYRTPSKTTDVNLYGKLVKNMFLRKVLDCKKPAKYSWLSDQTCYTHISRHYRISTEISKLIGSAKMAQAVSLRLKKNKKVSPLAWDTIFNLWLMPSSSPGESLKKSLFYLVYSGKIRRYAPWNFCIFYGSWKPYWPLKNYTPVRTVN